MTSLFSDIASASPIKVGQENYQRGLESQRYAQQTPIDTAQKQATVDQTLQQNQNLDTTNQTNQLALATTKIKSLQDAAINLTPDNYAIQKNLLESHGIVQPGVMPDQFDPAWKDATINKLAQAGQQLDIQAKQADIGYKQSQTTKSNAEVAQMGMFTPQANNPNIAGQTGVISPTNAPTEGAMPSPAPSGQYNEDYLSSLSPAAAAQVRGIAKGDLPMPSGRVLTTPYGQGLMNAVMQYDPTASAINLPVRQKTRQSFTSGQDAGNIAALNTAIAHLGKLSTDFGTLNNGDYPWLNSASNYLAVNTGNQDAQTATSNVDTDATATAHELAKVFRSSGMSEAEVKDWQDKINTSKTPAQAKAVIGSAIDLMDGRLNAIGDKYNQGMGTTIDPIQLLNPAAQKVYQTLKGITPDTGEKTSAVSEPITAINTTPAMADQTIRRNTASVSNALPMPTKKTALVAGKTYNTPRGLATWDGTQFTQ